MNDGTYRYSERKITTNNQNHKKRRQQEKTNIHT
ncbi:hypothetical protein CPL0016902_CDS0026 [Escherichia phage tunus]